MGVASKEPIQVRNPKVSQSPSFSEIYSDKQAMSLVINRWEVLLFLKDKEAEYEAPPYPNNVM